MATRHQKRDSMWQGLTLQIRHRDMPTKVVDTIEWHTPSRGISLACGRTHQQGTG